MPITFRPTIRQNAFAVAAATLLSLTPASYSFGQGLTATPVAATSEGITATTNCKAWKPGELMASEKCEILKGEFLKAQGKALDTQGQVIGTQNDCIGDLLRFKKAEPEKFRSMGFGTITRDNACSFANRLPKKAASLQ